MKFVINKEADTLEDVYQYLSGLGQGIYDELSDKEKKALDDLLNTYDEVTPALIDEILVNDRAILKGY